VIEAAVKRHVAQEQAGGTHAFELNVYKGDKHPHQAQKPQI